MIFPSKKKTSNFFFLLLSFFCLAFLLFVILLFLPHQTKHSVDNQFIKPSPSFSLPPLISQISHASRNNPQIALTFDADMTPFMIQELNQGKIKSWYNQEVVDILISKHIPATIFITGLWAETYPGILFSLSKNPLFEIENHSYSHPRFTPDCSALPDIPRWGKTGELEKSQSIIEKITGIKPNYFRFPGGCHSSSDIKLVNKYGLTVVDWDVASGDSFNNNREAIINTVKNKTQNGSIILFHFDGNQNSPQTSNVLPELIDYLQQKGYIFVKLHDLFSSLATIESQ